MQQLNFWTRVGGALSARKQSYKNLALMIFVQFFVAGIGVITQVKIANVLGIDNFGLIAYGMTIATYGAIFIRFGLDKTLVRDLVHSPNSYTSIVKASLVLRFALLGGLVLSVLGWKAIVPSTSDLSWGVVLVIVANMCISVDLQGVFDSWHKAARHSIFFLYQKGLYFALVWIVIAYKPALFSVFYIGSTMCVSVLLYLLMQYLWVFRRLPIDREKVDLKQIVIRTASTNLYVWLAALGLLSFSALNQLVLKHYHGAGALGGYAVAWMMVTIATILLTQIARLGSPATARITMGQATNYQKLYFLTKYVFLMLAVAFPVAIPAIAAPVLILESLFHSDYVVAAPILRLMGFYIFIVAIDIVAVQYILSARMEKIYLLSVLFGSLVSVFLCLVFIPAGGAVAAAWALLISHGILVSLYLIGIAQSFLSR